MEKYAEMGYDDLVSLVQNNNDNMALDYLINNKCKKIGRAHV